MDPELSNNIDSDTWLADVLSDRSADCNISAGRLLRFVSRFNLEIDATIRHHGPNEVAAAIWFVYGCPSGFMREILDASVGPSRLILLNSVKTLYAEGFEGHCVPDFQHQGLGSLNTACYMLWDMDSIRYAAHCGEEALLKASLDILAFALSLSNPACHLSALHGLGHLVLSHKSAVQPIIRRHLRSNPPQAERMYAETALTGCIQ